MKLSARDLSDIDTVLRPHSPADVARYLAERRERDRQYRRSRRAWLKAVRARRVLACALIRDGYKQQTRRAHPDAGGSSEAMHQITALRDALLAAVADLPDDVLMGTHGPTW